MEGQLAASVFDAGATFVGEEGADGGEVAFGGCEVKGVLGELLVWTVVTENSLVHVEIELRKERVCSVME